MNCRRCTYLGAYALSGYPPALIVPYQQLVDRFPFLGDGADRAKDAQPLDMEAVV